MGFYENTAAFEWQNPQKEGDSLNTVGCFYFPKVLRIWARGGREAELSFALHM